MGRTIPAALLSAITERECQPYFAFEALLDGGAIRIWTGFGDRTIEGETYTGNGALIGMGEINEVIDLTAESVTVTLSGLASGTLSAALAEPYQGRVANIYVGEGQHPKCFWPSRASSTPCHRTMTARRRQLR